MKRWWPVVAWMGLIFFLSSQPKLPPIPGQGCLDRLDYSDKILVGVKGQGQFGGVYMAWQVNNTGWWGEGEIEIKHLIGYAALALLIWRALGDACPKRRRFWLVVVMSTLYGATDEFHQWFVVGRCCDIFDLTANALGALCAAAILYTGGIRHGRREESKKRKERLRG